MTTTEPGAATGDVALRCARLVRIYRSPTGETHALRGVDAVFLGGTVSAVMGPSGSGKSSLLRILALREAPTAGELWIDGAPADRLRSRALRALRRRRLAWVAQRPTHGLMPHLTAAEHVTVASRARASRERPDEVLDRVELAHRARALPRRLSGGEQQRLAVAVALVGTPRLVVADEPTAELDDATAALVLAELRRCADAGSCVVVASHDPRLTGTADRVLALRHGVLSSDQDAGAEVTAVIDSTGRVQLPPGALGLFPDGRTRIHIDTDGVRLLPTDDKEAP